jgi:hypothetical protein
MDRPHIVRNASTGKYVCWLKIMDQGNVQTETVLVADHFLGPYEIVRTGLKPLGMHAGDFDLVVDPRDGKGYYYFERVHGELICADLTPDYTDVTGYYSTHFPRIGSGSREAPAHFSRGGKHYLLTSGTTWYFPNPTEVAVSDTYHGPFTVVGYAHRDDTELSSFGSQISSVFKHPGKKDLYIALADRWVPNEAQEYPRVRAGIKAMFSANAPEIPSPGTQTEGQEVPSFDIDTSVADYVWLPIRFDGDVPYLEWIDEWSIADFI